MQVIDALVLELGLDPSSFTKGQRDAMDSLRNMERDATRVGTGIEAQSKKTFDLLSSLRREAIAGMAIFFGGREAKQVFDHIVSLDAATSRLGRTMAMTAADVSMWQGAIQQAGGTVEGANSALSGLSGEMSGFQLTGQSAMLPVLSRLGISLYDQNRNLKTAGQLWLELADAVSGMDAREATSFLSMIPGANQDMINFALLGRRSMEEYLRAARAAGVTTEQSAAAARDYQRAQAQLEASSMNLARTLVTALAPALSKTMDAMRRLFTGVSSGANPATGEALGQGNASSLGKALWNLEMLGLAPFTGGMSLRFVSKYGESAPAGSIDAARGLLAEGLRNRAGGSSASPVEREAFIRQEAAKRGIDPEQAMRVARSEGFYNYVGDHGTSFGDFQLHVGGGLGDVFAAKTGLDPRDPTTWKQQAIFALDQAKAGGWGPWHGWHGDPWAGISRGGGGGNQTTVNVGGVTVYTSSDNGSGIARDVDAALQRSLIAGAANYGPQ